MAGHAVAPVALGAFHPRAAAIEHIAVLLAATEDDEPIVEPSSGHKMISRLDEGDGTDTPRWPQRITGAR